MTEEGRKAPAIEAIEPKDILGAEADFPTPNATLLDTAATNASEAGTIGLQSVSQSQAATRRGPSGAGTQRLEIRARDFAAPNSDADGTVTQSSLYEGGAESSRDGRGSGLQESAQPPPMGSLEDKAARNSTPALRQAGEGPLGKEQSPPLTSATARQRPDGDSRELPSKVPSKGDDLAAEYQAAAAKSRTMMARQRS